MLDSNKCPIKKRPIPKLKLGMFFRNRMAANIRLMPMNSNKYSFDAMVCAIGKSSLNTPAERRVRAGDPGGPVAVVVVHPLAGGIFADDVRDFRRRVRDGARGEKIRAGVRRWIQATMRAVRVLDRAGRGKDVQVGKLAAENG